MKQILLYSLLFSSILSYSQERTLVDGIFEEWGQQPVQYTDAAGDGGASGVDFGDLKIHHDDEFIFLFLETGVELNLQDENDITMYLDTDNSPATGFSINGIGADLVYTLGDRSGSFFESGNSVSISHPDIGLVTAPTVTSDRFEIAVRRDINLSGTPVFQGNEVKVVVRDNVLNGDMIPSLNEEIEYSFSTDTLGPLPAYSFQKKQASDLRILSYNVLSDGLFDQARIPAFTRILQAIQPDIIGFTEIYNYSPAQVATQLESILSSAPGQQWYYARQGPDCHAISRYPILASALIPGYNQGSGNGAFLIEVPGIEPDMLLIVAHPPCCSNNSGRQTEVDLIMEFVRESKAGNGPIPLALDAPIVIVGDMNLVGDFRQLETLLTGNINDEASYGQDFTPDWDNSNFLDSHPYITGSPFSFTWYREGSSFSPGRLDFIIYSGSNLLLNNRFSLFTPSLPQDSLNTYSLLADDVVLASDHLPIVADFELKNLTSHSDLLPNQGLGILSVHPNPSLGKAELSIRIDHSELVVVQLLAADGEEVAMLHQQYLPPGEHTVQLDTSAIPAGMYVVHVKTSRGSDSKKIVIMLSK